MPSSGQLPGRRFVDREWDLTALAATPRALEMPVRTAPASRWCRTGVVLRQVVRDLEPGCLRADEDVSFGTDAGAVVECSHGHEGDAPSTIAPGQLRAAAAAEDVEEEAGLGELVGADLFLAARDPHPVEGGE